MARYHPSQSRAIKVYCSPLRGEKGGETCQDEYSARTQNKKKATEPHEEENRLPNATLPAPPHGTSFKVSPWDPFAEQQGTKEGQKSLQQFSLFPRLPAEIRAMIWRESIDPVVLPARFHTVVYTRPWQGGYEQPTGESDTYLECTIPWSRLGCRWSATSCSFAPWYAQIKTFWVCRESRRLAMLDYTQGLPPRPDRLPFRPARDSIVVSNQASVAYENKRFHDYERARLEREGGGRGGFPPFVRLESPIHSWTAAWDGPNGLKHRAARQLAARVTCITVALEQLGMGLREKPHWPIAEDDDDDDDDDSLKSRLRGSIVKLDDPLELLGRHFPALQHLRIESPEGMHPAVVELLGGTCRSSRLLETREGRKEDLRLASLDKFLAGVVGDDNFRMGESWGRPFARLRSLDLVEARWPEKERVEEAVLGISMLSSRGVVMADDYEPFDLFLL